MCLSVVCGIDSARKVGERQKNFKVLLTMNPRSQLIVDTMCNSAAVPTAEHIQQLKDELNKARSAVRAQKRKDRCRQYSENHKESAQARARERYAMKSRATHTCDVCCLVVKQRNRASHENSARHKACLAVNGITEANDEV